MDAQEQASKALKLAKPKDEEGEAENRN